jgi:pyruvate dehydrogenase E1 component alpha subunit
LIENGIATEDQIAKLEARLDKDIEQAIAFAAASPKPSVDELQYDVLAGGVA